MRLFHGNLRIRSYFPLSGGVWRITTSAPRAPVLSRLPVRGPSLK